MMESFEPLFRDGRLFVDNVTNVFLLVSFFFFFFMIAFLRVRVVVQS